MHAFLRAIGFADALRAEREVEILLDNIFHTYDERMVVRSEDGQSAYLELTKSFGPNVGICVCGDMDAHGFHRTGYFPYLIGTGITTREEVHIEPSVNGAHFLGMADESRIGVSLIFFLQNAAQYRNARKSLAFSAVRHHAVILSALASSGTILLPMKNNTQSNRQTRLQYYERHDSLIERAKNGDEDAIESLTLEEMDTYAMITRRLMHEDIYTIVDSSFMPNGLSSDQYTIVGSILFYAKVRNTLTKEYMYEMTIDCNGLRFDVVVNEKDLLGDPEIGRRFKGNVWLQGRLKSGS